MPQASKKTAPDAPPNRAAPPEWSSLPALPARLVAVSAAHRAAPSGEVFRAAARADPLHESALGHIQSYRAIFRVDPQILQVSFADERLDLLNGFAGGEDGSKPVKGQALLRQREQCPRNAVRAGPAVCAAKNAKDRRCERGEYENTHHAGQRFPLRKHLDCRGYGRCRKDGAYQRNGGIRFFSGGGLCSQIWIHAVRHCASTAA